MTDLMTQPVYKGTVRRMQSVFRQMNIYDGPSDGLIGPAISLILQRIQGSLSGSQR